VFIYDVGVEFAQAGPEETKTVVVGAGAGRGDQRNFRMLLLLSTTTILHGQRQLKITSAAG
jgi:hypothetical protein